MYALLNTLLAQRQVIFITATAAGAPSTRAQLAPLVAATQAWIKAVQAHVREGKKKGFSPPTSRAKGAGGAPDPSHASEHSCCIRAREHASSKKYDFRFMINHIILHI
jgi:hypothetical protein